MKNWESKHTHTHTVISNKLVKISEYDYNPNSNNHPNTSHVRKLFIIMTAGNWF
jgi:hypothetical protein